MADCFECGYFPRLVPAHAEQPTNVFEERCCNGDGDDDGGGGGGGQLLEYTTTDPTTDGVVPTNQNQPAAAYKRDGSGAMFTWNTVTHVWV